MRSVSLYPLVPMVIAVHGSDCQSAGYHLNTVN